MLTAETKRTIDAARDVLVGKVPDPKAQVEQITTALIYKFMHDLDQESVALGGRAKYFSGDYEKFAWSSLLDTRLSGEARLDLYVRAVTSLERNPDLPQLFRDIFKGAFLPYNDPQTLTLFLKEINKLTYSHSEELGNAFEYLLSVLGSQGDAGQFRTPRHIIDFMVQVIDPKKHETILDPACGTAGFLISAYKHIFRHNTSAFKPESSPQQALGESAPELILADSALYSGDQLTPDERQRLTENIQGYDISPDMVRLSLVNLYLHGFPNPRIQEYDTLTSEQNWDQTFDVILANPPFMTPKGGIRPHRRFQVQAKRSEVLFVDYILEHLNPLGRAAVIVPEGVIFKSENAYKTLRRLLLDDGLYAVVSLPPGVFNPYSGVKTSILFFDMQVGRHTDELLFVRIQQDGFDLGAQRRKIEQDDLPAALRVLRAWQRGDKVESPLALWAEKTRIAADGDYNLSAERYRPVLVRLNQKWPLVELGDVLSYEQPTKYIVSNENYDDSFSTPVLTAGKSFILGYTNDVDGVFQDNLPVIIFDDFTTDIKFVDFSFKVKSSAMKILKANKDVAEIKYLYYMMRKIKFNSSIHKRYWISEYSKIKIPLPPLEVQHDIVEQIQVKQDAIDAARALIASLEKERRFFARELQDMEGVQWVELGEVCTFVRGPFGGSLKKEIFKPSGYLVYEQYHAINNDFSFSRYFIDENKFQEMKRFEVFPGDLLISCSGTMGKIVIVPKGNKKGIINQALLKLTPDSSLVYGDFLKIVLETDFIQDKFFKNQAGSGIQNVSSVSTLKKIKIPLPILDVQKEIIEKNHNEDQFISINEKLIILMGKKIDKVLECVC